MSDGMDATFPVLLWDLLPRTPQRAEGEVPIQIDLPHTPTHPHPSHPTLITAPSGQARYDQLVSTMKARHGIRVRKWRSTTTGCAWQVVYEDGHLSQLIESPYPRGPMSCAVFLHEVGHHAIGFYRYKPRCLEEYKAWEWALETMRQHGIQVTDRVLDRVEESMRYAVGKAVRRGIKNLPPELERFNDIKADTRDGVSVQIALGV